MATKAGETSPSAPANPSPLNPRRSVSPTRTSLERTSLERPAPGPAASLLSQIASNVNPVEVAPGFGAKKDGSGSGRPQPSLREALGRVRAGLGDSGPGSAISPTTGASALSPISGGGVVGGGPGGRGIQQQQQRHQSAIDRTDAVWAEMQQTLRDVELSAAGGTHFFGRGHPKALEELRTAQIALAQAWARGSAQSSSAAAGGGTGSAVGGAAANETAAEPKEKDKDKDVDASSQKSPGASASDADADETEADMAAARRRREASDRYFERVSKHVGEVTKKLEDVAVAMGKVEEESREGWSESDNLESASQTS